MQLICILVCRTWPVCRYRSQTFHDSCRADHSSCFELLGLWDDPSCSGNNWYCLDLFFFFACTQNCMTCYNSLFMLSVRALSCFGRWSKKRRPRSTETNLPGCLSWQALWICAALKFITPTYRETNKQPNLRLPEPQLQRAVALLTFTAQCFSYPSSSPLFFFLLSCLKANNFLISKVVSTSLGGNVLKDEGRCQG